MPRESLNVYLSGTDNLSPVLASITDKTKALDKESQELTQSFAALQKANKSLIEQKTELQKKLKEVNEEVKAARKQFNELHDEASSDALNKATEKQQALKNAIAGTTKSLQENQKMYKENIEIARKNALGEEDQVRKNALGGDNQGASLTGLSGLGTIVAGLGVWDQVSSIVQSGASKALTSAFGSGAGGIASGALSSAISGAVLGSTIMPGLGTAVGALAGGAVGALGGALQEAGNRDDAFKEYYGGLYDDVKGRSGEMVEAGSSIAGGREQTRMAFAQRLGGDDQATAYLARVEEMAANTNYEYDEIVGYAKLLLNSYDPDEVFGVLRDLSDATAGLDLSSGDVNMMISGLSRMRTTGKATQEYLNYFRERGVDVDQALAGSLGVEKSSISDMVTDGQIGGEDAAQAILDFIQETFGGLSDDLASTYDAMVDNLGDITSSIQAAGGDAYNELRKEGIQEEVNALGGELGDAISEINAVMAENQARKENLQDQYMREVVGAVLTGNRGELWDTFDAEQQNRLAEMGEQYASLMEQYEESGRTDAEASAEMESLYEQAQILGQAYFDNSDFVKMLNETELDEIEAIQQATAGLENAYTALYDVNQTMSKGLAVRMGPGTHGALAADAYIDERGIVRGAKAGYEGAALADEGAAANAYIDERGIVRSHAFGLNRVPYDDYPALLHQGERVLTTSEARAQDAGQGGGLTVPITGNTFVGVNEEMADQLFEIIVRKLEQAYTAAAPK